mgnify:CR=1 FL=1
MIKSDEIDPIQQKQIAEAKTHTSKYCFVQNATRGILVVWVRCTAYRILPESLRASSSARPRLWRWGNEEVVYFGFLFLLLAVVILLITGCPWFWKEGYVKNEPPEVNKVSGPDGEISENSSTFTWTGKEYDGTITKYEYRKDEGSWESNATNKIGRASCRERV